MPESQLPLELSPAEVRHRLDSGEKLILIDVREPSEFQISRILGAELIPMRSVPARLPELDAMAGEAALVFYCHHGVRSLNVAHWMRQQGVDSCSSMSGGIDGWSRHVDPSVKRY